MKTFFNKFFGAVMRFNEEGYARAYDKRLTDEGYPGDIVPLLKKHLEGCASVLDIGAGSGFIALPLAEAGFRVTAIEPSRAMLTLLEEKLGNRRIPLTTSNYSWEEWNGKKKDAAISIHSLYPMKNTVKAVQKMIDYSGRTLILIRSETRSVTVSHRIREKLGDNGSSRVSAENFDDILHDLGLYFEKVDFPQERVTSFTDLSAEVDYYADHLKCDPLQRSIIEETVLAYCRKDGDTWYNRTYFHDVLYIIMKQKG